MTYQYKPSGVCSRQFTIEVEDGKIASLAVLGGCDGNLKGISKLVQGRPVEEIATLLEGITCGKKATSCPDQLSKALKEIMGE